MQRARSKMTSQGEKRLFWLKVIFAVFIAAIAVRLFHLQVVKAAHYNTVATKQHSLYRELFPERGSILVRDWKTGQEFFAATNEPRAFLYAEPRRIENPREAAIAVGEILGYLLPPETEAEIAAEEIVAEEPAETILEGILEPIPPEVVTEEVVEVVEEPVVEEVIQELAETPLSEEEAEIKRRQDDMRDLIERFSKVDDPYEPIARNIPEETLEKILDLDITGIRYILEDGRAYPEKSLGGHVFGFLGSNGDGAKVGSYGIEGYFNEMLTGQAGFLDTKTDQSGTWIGVGSRTFKAAENGSDIVLTIDRTIQYTACDALYRAVERYKADGGSILIVEPKTGRIMAMCNAPDFDPNTYSEVEDISAYNNRAIFEAYEPGSVFKPIVMAAAIDKGKVTPNTLFTDYGEEKIDQYTIRNSDLKAHGLVDMTYVLQNSLNTGMIFTMRQLGMPDMKKYLQNFGFGQVAGIELKTESPGTIASLENNHELYYATASYGQGITTTVLQLAMAYGAIANGGELMQPYIVDEIRHQDGSIEKSKPHLLRRVISSKAATTTGAMLVSVVEEGHAGGAAVPGYYMAGKTGTAQVARTDGAGYQVGVTNATFVGYGPIEDPAFVMVVWLDHPTTSQWAAETSAYVFGEVADFILHYLEIAPRRSIE